MTGRPVVGLVAALFVEARHWVSLRWDFDDSSYESAWQLSFVLMALVAVMIWLDESRYTAVLVLLTWMPPLLLPLQFVQAYGSRDSVDLGAFSIIARRNRRRNQRLGLMVESARFNFGNVLLIVTILAAAVGVEEDSVLFLPGLVVLCGWALMGTRRCRLPSLIPVMVLAGLCGFAGQLGLEHVEKWLRRGSGDQGNQFDPYFHSTLIGSRGRVMQSPEILWRLKTPAGSLPPRLLRTAAFRNFLGTSWQNQRVEFKELNARITGTDTYHMLTDKIDVDDFDSLSSFTLRGSVDKKSPLPLPGDAVAVSNLDDDWVERNPLGTVRIFPVSPVIDSPVYWGGGTNPEVPAEKRDLTGMAPVERDVIKRMVDETGLDQIPGVAAKMAHLRKWFHENFRYTLDLTIRQPTHKERVGQAKRPSALSQFLTDVRAGHCEYFATAAALMLREAGVPSRYAIGFAVMELDTKRGSHVIRGTHSHAWCRVWDEDTQRWLDFDPTPPDWFAELTQNDTLMQRMKDRMKRFREDFYLWRSDPDNEWLVMMVVSCIGLSLSVVVVRRLWRSRSQRDATPRADYTWRGESIRTPVHDLESLLRARLGERPPGQPFGEWLTGLRPGFSDAALLNEVLALHQCMRFDPQPMPDERKARLGLLAQRLKQQLEEGSAGEVVDHGHDLGG